MCERESKDSDLKTEERFFAEATCIIKKSFMKFIKGCPREEYNPHWPEENKSVYPKANIYYAFAEDANPFERIHLPFESAKNIYTYQRFGPPKDPFLLRDPYSEAEARRKYLETKPTCFAIFGKPDMNTSKLAAIIAKLWNCVLISPLTIIEQEIELKTETGKSIIELLKAGDCVGGDIIMNLIRNRVKMRDVKHRGYVIEGLPLIPNENLDFSSYFKGTDDTCVCEKRNYPCGSGKHNYLGADISAQINNIFQEWQMPPSIIIYVLSPNEDVIKRRECFRLDLARGDIFDSPVTETNEGISEFLLQDVVETDACGPLKLYWDLINEGRIIYEDRDKYLVKRISDMRRNVEFQCKFYQEFALPIIDKWLLCYNPENVIRVDGRCSVSRMLQVVNARLRILPISRVLVPKRMLESIEEEFGEELKSTDNDVEKEFQDLSNEEAYQELMNKETISLRFPWRLSPWLYLCPVELAKGRTINGQAKYSVRFMSKIYFLSSQEAVSLFLENPRPFLLSAQPRPTCKIVIFGPDYSGKSQLCRELARIFRGTVVNVKKKEEMILEERISAKVASAMQEKVKDVIEELKNNLEAQREIRESRRRDDLHAWYKGVLPTVQRYFELMSFIREENKSEEEESEITEEIDSLREVLRLHKLEDIEQVLELEEKIISNEEVLFSYAPEYLLREEPPIRELTEHDPEVLDILEDRVKYIYQDNVNLSASEKANLVIESIKSIPKEKIDEDLWRDRDYIVDGMYTDTEVWKKVVSDAELHFEDAVLLLDEAPYKYLVNKWRRMNQNRISYNYSEYTEIPVGNKQEEDGSKDIDLGEYINHIQQFESEWNMLREAVEAECKNLIICNIGTVNNTSNYVMKCINDRYSEKPKVLSDEEIEMNRELYEDEPVLSNEDTDFEDLPDNQEVVEGKDSNYPLGDSNYYCPVALMKHNIFWKGKMNFSTSFMGKIYLLSSSAAMEEFIQKPAEFCIPFKKPVATIPRLRISIVGPPASGKTVFSQAISKEYGLAHIDYYDSFNEYMKSRGMPVFEWQNIFLPSDEDSVDSELPEDLNSQEYNCNSQVIKSFLCRYWENGATLPNKLLKECVLDFFQPPFHNSPVIFDAFPSCVEDMEVSLEKCIVPELIIELRCGMETCIERMLPLLESYWQQKQKENQRYQQQRYTEEMEAYTNEREAWIQRTLKERQRERQRERQKEEKGSRKDHHEYEKEHLEDPDWESPSSASLLEGLEFEEDTINPDAEDSARITLEDLWKLEHSEPVLSFHEEDFEVVREYILNKLEEVYENELKKLELIRETLENESIPWVEINTEKSMKQVLFEIMKLLDPYVFRNVSILERAYRIDSETAESLLDSGYYFLSSFGRWCPVQLYENKNPIQMFLPLEVLQDIYPIIHRQYIYFLGGKDAAAAFEKDPLKYLEQDSCSPIIPLRISIIGPPKCGKSTLAKRFAKIYGMKIITRGAALRKIIQKFPWTNLAEKINSHLKIGDIVPDECVILAVEMLSIDPCSTSQGLIFDGFPTKRKEFELLTFKGLQPMIVIDLQADLDFCLECLTSTIDDYKSLPTFSRKFFLHYYKIWTEEEHNYRSWLKKYSQNVIALDSTKSRAYTWSRADEAVRHRFKSIKSYFRECDFDKVHKLEFMCISPYEFREHQSPYEGFCPLCWTCDNSLITSGPPPDSPGMVQFRENFYWICEKHIKNFSIDPLKYLSLEKKVTLPEDRPRILNGTVDLDCGCWGSRLQAEGYCLVTYVDNLPHRRLVAGKLDLGISYKEKLFLFCSNTCREEFLIHPLKYANAELRFYKKFPEISVKSLPALGFLEQTVANLIIQGLNDVCVLRPKIPGLTASSSAAIYLGVFLKTHNTSCKVNETEIYKKVYERLRAHLQIIKSATKTMMKKLNPFIYIPDKSVGNLVQNASEISQLSSKMINLIKFRRTSPTQILVDPDEFTD